VAGFAAKDREKSGRKLLTKTIIETGMLFVSPAKVNNYVLIKN
jgi:hypothetical protein